MQPKKIFFGLAEDLFLGVIYHMVRCVRVSFAQNRNFSPDMHRGDRGGEFRSKSAENAKIFHKIFFFFGKIFKNVKWWPRTWSDGWHGFPVENRVSAYRIYFFKNNHFLGSFSRVIHN